MLICGCRQEGGYYLAGKVAYSILNEKTWLGAEIARVFSLPNLCKVNVVVESDSQTGDSLY